MTQAEEMANELLDEDAKARGVTLASMGILTAARIGKLRQREVPLSAFDGLDSLSDIRARDRELAIAHGRRRTNG